VRSFQEGCSISSMRGAGKNRERSRTFGFSIGRGKCNIMLVTLPWSAEFSHQRALQINQQVRCSVTLPCGQVISLTLPAALCEDVMAAPRAQACSVSCTICSTGSANACSHSSTAQGENYSMHTLRTRVYAALESSKDKVNRFTMCTALAAADNC
jgi:hypothetical protein